VVFYVLERITGREPAALRSKAREER